MTKFWLTTILPVAVLAPLLIYILMPLLIASPDVYQELCREEIECTVEELEIILEFSKDPRYNDMVLEALKDNIISGKEFNDFKAVWEPNRNGFD
jgi:hypothetical protein